jgi:membrane fusion protein (multidrug efflux system)
MPTTMSGSESATAARSSIPLRAALPVALLAALGCGGKKEEPKAPPVPEVRVAEVIQRDVPIGRELTATLRGFEDVEIRVRVEGYLRSIDYQEGTEVKRGQLLFTIDDQPYRARLAEAKAELARAESMLAKADLDVNRYAPLAQKRAISQAELDNAVAAQRSARAQVDASRASVEKATLDLGYCRIASPVAGLAGQAQRKAGDLVGKGEPTLLATVSSIDPIRVSVNIPEGLYLKYASALPRSKGGTQAEQRQGAGPGAGPGAELVLADGSVFPERGRIVLIDRAVDPQTGTLRADLAFKNPNKLLRPGLYGKVRFAAEQRAGALLVPQRAVLETQGQFSVVVVNAESKAETRTVKVGPRIGSLWILEDGVKPGEKVVVEGARRILDGAPVKATVVPAEAEPAAAAGRPEAQAGAAAGAPPVTGSTGAGAPGASPGGPQAR